MAMHRRRPSQMLPSLHNLALVHNTDMFVLNSDHFELMRSSKVDQTNLDEANMRTLEKAIDEANSDYSILFPVTMPIDADDYELYKKLVE
jgi:hypothetical protein